MCTQKSENNNIEENVSGVDNKVQFKHKNKLHPQNYSKIEGSKIQGSGAG